MYNKLREYLIYSCKDVKCDDLLKKLNKLNKINKKRLNLIFFQKHLSINLQELLKNNDRYYLLGCIPRIGKSYIIADLILKQKFKNVLILSRLKTNLIDIDLYEGYCDFEENEYNIHLYDNNNLENINFNKKNIVINTPQSINNHNFLHNKFDIIII